MFVAFSILLGFNPDHPAAHNLNVLALKELVGTVYSSFVGDHLGVPMHLIQNLFAGFAPTVLLAVTDPNMIVRIMSLPYLSPI